MTSMKNGSRPSGLSTAEGPLGSIVPGRILTSSMFEEPMRVVMEHGRARGCVVEDVSARNLGYDLTSLDPRSGEMRLIEVKGLAAATGTILLTPNEHRVTEDGRDCYWLYIVTNCAAGPVLQQPARDPARFSWHQVTKVQHSWLQIDAMTRTLKISEDLSPYGGEAT